MVLLVVVAHEDHHEVVAQRPEDRLVRLDRLIEQGREVAPEMVTLFRSTVLICPPGFLSGSNLSTTARRIILSSVRVYFSTVHLNHESDPAGSLTWN